MPLRGGNRIGLEKSFSLARNEWEVRLRAPPKGQTPAATKCKKWAMVSIQGCLWGPRLNRLLKAIGSESKGGPLIPRRMPIIESRRKVQPWQTSPPAAALS